MPIRYVGRDPVQFAKSLYEICRQLRDWGVGRVVYKHRLSELHPTQKSYFRLTSVVPVLKSPGELAFQIWGHEVFRGREKGVNLITEGRKLDWVLVPKEEEKEFCAVREVYDIKQIPVPTHMNCPPLLELSIKGEMKARGQAPPEKIQIPFIADNYIKELDSYWA
ncbi:unnamed protein product [Candidula unifasciata]|uniref:28S ribosomal protein S34, mitochondrial n=1 Tax=Candidula unifasciata TaxID=100452 RepID=A0A8S3YF14_9EUPU|nr:unnamed protein product [Candidula unifasciata]